MRKATAATPLWVRALLIGALVSGAGWWLADRHDRVRNQQRLGAIASALAGRSVEVRCPGPLRRRLVASYSEGTVGFDADGRPADHTRLEAGPCAELDALAEGRRRTQLTCVERSSACGDDVQVLARAVDVLAHEAWHLHGIRNEGVAECRSLQSVAWAAEQLGATAAQGHGLARLHHETGYLQLPDRYRHPGCRDGGELDLRPGDPRWP